MLLWVLTVPGWVPLRGSHIVPGDPLGSKASRFLCPGAEWGFLAPLLSSILSPLFLPHLLDRTMVGYTKATNSKLYVA